MLFSKGYISNIYKQIEELCVAFENVVESNRVFVLHLLQETAYALVDVFSFVQVGMFFFSFIVDRGFRYWNDYKSNYQDIES